MSDSWEVRTLALIGEEGVRKAQEARVLVVGVGGVGGYAVEMLARTGIGHLTLVDADDVAESNLNRQLIALRTTVGLPKTRLFADRIADINPDCRVEAIAEFLTPENAGEMVGEMRFDLVIDAIYTVAPKVALISWCLHHRIPILSSMGAGGRMDPSKVYAGDLWETREDGLARAVRQRLKKAGLRRPLRVVASSEAPRPSAIVEVGTANKRTSYGTTAIVPSTFGIYLAAEALRLLGIK